jgi:hypothetical protein
LSYFIFFMFFTIFCKKRRGGGGGGKISENLKNDVLLVCKYLKNKANHSYRSVYPYSMFTGIGLFSFRPLGGG